MDEGWTTLGLHCRFHHSPFSHLLNIYFDLLRLFLAAKKRAAEAVAHQVTKIARTSAMSNPAAGFAPRGAPSGNRFSSQGPGGPAGGFFNPPPPAMVSSCSNNLVL